MFDALQIKKSLKRIEKSNTVKDLSSQFKNAPSFSTVFDTQLKLDDTSSDLSEKVQTCKKQFTIQKKGTATYSKLNTEKPPRIMRLLTTEEKQKEG